MFLKTMDKIAVLKIGGDKTFTYFYQALTNQISKKKLEELRTIVN